MCVVSTADCHSSSPQSPLSSSSKASAGCSPVQGLRLTAHCAERLQPAQPDACNMLRYSCWPCVSWAQQLLNPEQGCARCPSRPAGPLRGARQSRHCASQPTALRQTASACTAWCLQRADVLLMCVVSTADCRSSSPQSPPLIIQQGLCRVLVSPGTAPHSPQLCAKRLQPAQLDACNMLQHSTG